MEFNSPMAKQFNGPVIDSLLNARHNTFNESEEFMLHRQGLTLENATTEELDLIGKFLCIPRPYAMVNGEPEYCDDAFYRIYIQNLAILRQSQSIYDLARMFDQFMPDGRYFVSFQPNGDLLVVLDEQYIAYTPFFQKALDSVFTALPRINTLESWDFDKFVYQHRLYTRLISLKNSDWVFGIRHSSAIWAIVTSSGKVYTSTDLVSWTQTILSHSLRKVYYANGKWVAVGNRSVYASDDALHWNEVYSTSDPVTFRAIIYVNGIWLVAGTGNTVLTSTDNTDTWSMDHILYDHIDFMSLFYDGTNIFLVGADSDEDCLAIATSSDGINWTLKLFSTLQVNPYCCVGDRSNTVIAAGEYTHDIGIGSVVISTNAFNTVAYHDVSFVINDMIYKDNKWIAVGYVYDRNYSIEISAVGTSSNGMDWNVQQLDQITSLTGLYEFEDTFVACGSEGKIAISTDAISWTIQDIASSSESLRSIYCDSNKGGTLATIVSPSGKLTVTNHKATATIERRT